MDFPAKMIEARRWMVRPKPANGNKPKQPFSAYETRPLEYDPQPGKDAKGWRRQWTNPAVLSDYKTAVSYWDRHPEEVEGLSYVIHPLGDTSDSIRLICIDLDGVVDNSDNIHPEVCQLLYILDTYVEYSRSGSGLHVFALVRCEPFTNVLQGDFAGAKVDILCQSQVAVTGRVFSDYSELNEVPYEYLKSLPFFEHKKPTKVETEAVDWWSEEPTEGISPENSELAEELRNWEHCEEGNGGDRPFFAAACHILRHGVTGWEADELLQLVPATPPFSLEERKHRIECAYAHTITDGTFKTYGVANEFDIVETTDKEEEKDPRKVLGILTLRELFALDLTIEWLVEGLFVDREPMFIGGMDKTFKTGMAADLVISLASKTPFLGKFPVLEPRRSVFFTAEIGFPAVSLLFKRIVKARNIPDCWDNVDVADFVPNFQLNRMGIPTAPKELEKLEKYLDFAKPEVAVFDPLYFALGGSDVGDMYAIGAVLRNISGICTKRGIWPIFCHHSRKGVETGSVMQREDFYGSGVSAFARQWLLMSHAEDYQRGVARMFANIGGSSAGGRGVWDVTIDEGIPDDIMDRKWDVTVVPYEESTAGKPTYQDIQRVLGDYPDGLGIKDISQRMPKGKDDREKIEDILRAMLQSQEVEMRGTRYTLRENDNEFV